MITLILAWINAKYYHDYQGVFVAAFILDLALIERCFKLIG